MQFRVECPPSLAGPINQAGFSVKVMPQVNRELIGHDVCAALASYRGPVLLLNGKWDLIFRRDERALRTLAPQATLEVIPGAAHLSNLHRPQVFNDAIRGFARSVP
jgi:pimeloyl-ACP methyl ester carboxylesterase